MADYRRVPSKTTAVAGEHVTKPVSTEQVTTHVVTGLGVNGKCATTATTVAPIARPAIATRPLPGNDAKQEQLPRKHQTRPTHMMKSHADHQKLERMLVDLMSHAHPGTKVILNKATFTITVVKPNRGMTEAEMWDMSERWSPYPIDRVRVVSKRNGREQYVMEQSNDSMLTPQVDTECVHGRIKRGTEITCYLKENQSQFLERNSWMI